MSQERDKQFQGFAKALLRDLAQEGFISWLEINEEIIQAIARREYDFSLHVAYHTRGAISRDPAFVVKHKVPDMPELPKETQ